MKLCQKVLKRLKIKYETKIVSAHRTPDRMYEFAKSAEKNDVSVIIAGAGGSAHLPGMVAALTAIPVIGIPKQTTILNFKTLRTLSANSNEICTPTGKPIKESPKVPSPISICDCRSPSLGKNAPIEKEYIKK